MQLVPSSHSARYTPEVSLAILSTLVLDWGQEFGKKACGNIVCVQERTEQEATTRGTWVAPLVKIPTLHFGTGHDPRVVKLSPESGSTLSGTSA